MHDAAWRMAHEGCTHLLVRACVRERVGRRAAQLRRAPHQLHAVRLHRVVVRGDELRQAVAQLAHARQRLRLGLRRSRVLPLRATATAAAAAGCAGCVVARHHGQRALASLAHQLAERP